MKSVKSVKFNFKDDKSRGMAWFCHFVLNQMSENHFLALYFGENTKLMYLNNCL